MNGTITIVRLQVYHHLLACIRICIDSAGHRARRQFGTGIVRLGAHLLKLLGQLGCLLLLQLFLILFVLLLLLPVCIL